MDRTRKHHNYQRRTTNKKVAIVGIGCRFPSDIKNVREFWEVISAGTDCMKPHPKERMDPSFLYPGEKIPGKIYSRAAGYLSQNINEFDRLFFQTSPEEADYMDPQLRLLLEVVWESLEDYGVSVADLRKSDTGVYVGVMAREYLTLVSDPNININKYTASGNNSNMISNRISYYFDFQGPSITYDTACSSSMYAIHQACEAIRNEDCNLVLAGGVNLFLLPSTFIALSQAEMLSPDGKCKSFDSSADGYSRGEGAGILVLKSLEQSMIDGDRIYAVITGGSLNNDGKTMGITAPSTRAQVRLLQQAYDNANLSPHEVPYVEAHGTGTQAGDTAELSAIGSVMRKGRGKKHPPLFIGSVKSNIGHTEGAAGVAGVIKAALVLQKRQIPKVVHFQSRNRNISWDDTGEMIFPTELTRWPDGFKYIAGCSSFGFGGANAHLVLESAPPQEKCHKEDDLPTLLFLSAASKEALNQRATDWLTFLRKSSDSDFWNIVRTAATRATHHPYRLAICAQSLEQSITILEERQNSPLGVNNMLVEGRVQAMSSDQSQKLVFVFSGMGTQWLGMGRQLMQVNAVFRRTIIDADKLLREFGAKWSLQAMLTTETDKERINDTAIAQPSICAVQIALAEVYRHLGILPHAVVGHSVGEVAAACVAGYISFHDAMRLIYIRGKSLRRTAEKGTMAAVFKEVNEVKGKLSEDEFLGKVDIACVNSATQTVISGNSDAIAKLVDFYKSQGVRCVSLKVRNAFHSFQQEHIEKYFFEHARSKLFQNRTQSGGKYLPRQVPMVSTVTSEFVTAKDLNDSTYWWQNIRQTVWFEESLKKLLKNGYNVFLEISPHPSLTSSIKHTMGVFLNKIEASFHEEHTVIGSLKKPDDVSQTSQDNVSILMSIAKLYTRGYPLNLKMIFPNEPFNVTSLPSYPWQRQLCFAVSEEAKRHYMTATLKRPLLGQPQDIFCDESDIENRRAWKSDYDLASLPWLPHHKIENAILLPGAAFIDMMLTVAKEIQVGFDTVTLKNIKFHKFHYSPQCHGTLSTTAVRSNSGSQWHVAVRTCKESNKSWVQNATCTFDLSADNISSHEEILDVNGIQEKCDTFLTGERFYQRLAEKRVEIGSMFGSVSCAFYNTGRQECLIFAAIPEIISNECNDFIFHPCLLDVAFQLFAGFSFESESPIGGRTVQVPQSASIVCLKGSAPSEIVFHGRKFVENGKEYVNATIANSTNQKIFATLEQVELVALGSNVKDDRIQFFEKEWTAVAPEDTVSSSQADTMPSIPLQNQEDYLIVSDSAQFADKFIHAFLKAGISPEHLVKRNLSDKMDNPFSKGESSFLNVIVLTFMSVADFKSLDDISRDQFFQSQINEPVSLIHTITGLYSKFDLKQLSIWIVTKGAVVAVESDTSVNPLMSNGLTLNMTLMNENPDLFVTTLDLPLNQSPEDSVQWLSKFFLKPERSENCLALRKVKSKDYSDFQMFSWRLRFPSTPSISIKKKSDKWFFDISSEVKGNPLKAINLKTVKAANDKGETSQKSEISVQVEAFCKQYWKSISKPKERSVGFLFSGNIIQSANRDGEKVIGYIRNNIVRPSVTTKSRDVVSISEKRPIRASQALFVVQKCFPLYLALQETFKVNEGSVIIITSDEVNFNIYRQFGYLITSSEKTKVAQVIIYVQNAQQLPSNLQTHEKVKLATKQTLHALVRDGTVDTLLIHSNCVVTSKEADPLFNKVRFHGTIAVLGDILVHSNVIKARQIGVRTVEPEYMWESVNADFTHTSISALLDLFFSNGELSEDTNHLINAVKVDEIGDGQDIDSNIFLASADINVPFGYNDSIHLFKAKPNSSYLVVGGTNGLGREIARWLVCQGAMRVYISGRSEPASQELGKMKSVEYIKCDITNEKETEKMLQTLKNGPFPLTGIFHCAALFEDQQLEKVTKEAWTKVTLPKAYGLLLLHKWTTKLKIPLETFVALSSIVEYLGNVGQGSYCNANAFVSSLCLERRLKTLPGTFVAPGAIQDVGYAARKGYDKLWAKHGITSLSPSEVINCLSWLLLNESKGIGLTGTLHMENFIKSKIQVFSHQLKTNRISLFKREFHLGMMYPGSSNNSTNLLASLNPPKAETVIKVLNNFLLTRMGISEDIPPEIPFSSLGFDSAMSWELSSLIWSQFNIVVTSLELLNDSSSLSNISSLILSRSSKSNAQENDSANKNVGFANTLWLNTPRKMSSPHADLICFPPTGKGVSLFAGWVEKFETSGIQVTVAQLPGWEGRENESASNDLTSLVTVLSNAILSRPTLTRLVFFGCGIGALLAFEIARYLQTEHNIAIKHVFICAWYPPSTPYASSMELKEPTKREESVLSNANKTAKFLDNRDIRQSQFPEKAFLNMKASETICKRYKYVMSKPLECNMTIYTGVRDPILTQKVVGKWKNEINPEKEFENVALQTDHKLLRVKKLNAKIASHLSRSLLKENKTRYIT